MGLWNKMETAPAPCEAEFTTFEAHFLRAIKQQHHQLPVHLVLSDVDSWGESQHAPNKPAAAAQIRDGRLTVSHPQQWSRLTRAIAASPLPWLSQRLMERVEAEQAECRRATALLDDLLVPVASDLGHAEDKQLAALLLDYIVAKKDYVTSLRQSRRDVENINKQAAKVLLLLKPYRRPEDSEDASVVVNGGDQ